MYKNKHQAAIQIQKIWRGYYIRETYIKKIRRLYEKIILQMENVCCLPEALVEIDIGRG